MGINASVDVTFDTLDKAVKIVAMARKGSRNGVAQNRLTQGVHATNTLVSLLNISENLVNIIFISVELGGSNFGAQRLDVNSQAWANLLPNQMKEARSINNDGARNGTREACFVFVSLKHVRISRCGNTEPSCKSWHDPPTHSPDQAAVSPKVQVAKAR